MKGTDKTMAKQVLGVLADRCKRESTVLCILLWVPLFCWGYSFLQCFTISAVQQSKSAVCIHIFPPSGVSFPAIPPI